MFIIFEGEIYNVSIVLLLVVFIILTVILYLYWYCCISYALNHKSLNFKQWAVALPVPKFNVLHLLPRILEFPKNKDFKEHLQQNPWEFGIKLFFESYE